MKVIYEPKGRAKEYAELAVNLYNGCSHACEYCYAPQVMHKKREDFFGNPSPRKDIFPKLVKDVEEMARNKDKREVLMCFSCDPYQQIDTQYQFTRRAIILFNENNIQYSILTKGGKRSERDFDLIAEHPELCRYGVTLTCGLDEDSLKWEHFAAPTSERIDTLKKAHALGIPTWASFEPVLSPEDACHLISQTCGFVDEYRIGKLNYHPLSKKIDWKKARDGIVSICEICGVNYTLKNDLVRL
jgi:DNA repair photolyase